MATFLDLKDNHCERSLQLGDGSLVREAATNEQIGQDQHPVSERLQAQLAAWIDGILGERGSHSDPLHLQDLRAGKHLDSLLSSISSTPAELPPLPNDAASEDVVRFAIIERWTVFNKALLNNGIEKELLVRPTEVLQDSPSSNSKLVRLLTEIAVRSSTTEGKSNAADAGIKAALDEYRRNRGIDSCDPACQLVVEPDGSKSKDLSIILDNHSQLLEVLVQSTEAINKRLADMEATLLEAIGSSGGRSRHGSVVTHRRSNLVNVSAVDDSDDDAAPITAASPASRRLEQFRNTSDQASTESLGYGEEVGSGKRPTSGDSSTLSPGGVSSMSPLSAVSPNAKLFAKVPSELVNSGLPKTELMRLAVVYELIDTEADYVRDLNVMLNYHKIQIKKQRLLSEDDINLLFSNIDILVATNQQFLDKINSRKEMNPAIPEIGDVISQCAESFKVYTVYCGNYPSAMKLIHTLQQRPEFKDHLQRMMNSTEGRGLSLESFMIKPVQRICKYPLLLRELIKHTEKSSKDHAALIVAAEGIEAVVALVNEATRAIGDREKILAIQSKIDAPGHLNLENKKLLKEGTVTRVLASKAKERYIILFADVMVMCKPMNRARYQLDMVSPVIEMIVKAEVKAESILKAHKYAFQLLLLGGKEPIVLSCSDEAEKRQWVEAFQDAMKRSLEEQRRTGGVGPHSNVASNVAISDLGGDRKGKRSSADSTLGKRFSDQYTDVTNGGTTGSAGAAEKAGERKSQRVSSNFAVGSPGTLKRGVWGSIRRQGRNVGIAEGVSASNFFHELLADDGQNDGQGVQNTPTEMEQEHDVTFEPEMVDIQGAVWKRAVSAWAASYYFNTQTKETIWKLPETGVVILDPLTGKPLDQTEDTEEDDEITDVSATMVDGFPEWRRVVDPSDENNTYYFHTETQETSWFHPADQHKQNAAHDIIVN